MKDEDEEGPDCNGSCLPSRLPCHCSSETKDGDETSKDCGGSCLPCTCFDGVQSPDEVGIDCGAACRFPCECLDGHKTISTVEDCVDGGPVCSQRGSSGKEPSARARPYYSACS